MPERTHIPRVTSLCRRARLRRFARLLLDTSGRTLLVGAAVGVGLALWEVALGLPVRWPVAIGASLAISGFIAAGLSLARRGSLLDAAREIDSSLGLEDRLSNALALSEHESNDSFVSLATTEGETFAQEADLKRAIPIRLSNHWVWWPALASIAISVGMFAPRFDLLGAHEKELVSHKQETELALASQNIRDAREKLKESLTIEQDEPLDLATQAALRALDELAEELEAGVEDPDVAREKAAAALDEAAQESDKRAEESLLKENAARELMQQITQGSGENDEQETEPIDELRESLADRDPESAARAIEELETQARELSPEKLAELQKQLEQLAEDIEQASEDEASRVEDERQSERDELGEWGLDEEDAQSLQNEPSEDEIRDELIEKGFDEDAARESAERIAEAERERRAREKAAEDAKELSEELKEAADELGDPDESPQDESPSDRKSVV